VEQVPVRTEPPGQGGSQGSLAATPPPISTREHPFSSATARIVFSTSTSSTASWNERATAARSASRRPSAASASTWFRTAVLSPLKEKA
jgi:hypothetical protein